MASNPFEERLMLLQQSLNKNRAALLQKVGATGLEFIDQNFQLGGFQGATFSKWPKRNPDRTPGRALLYLSGHLRGGNRFMPIGGEGVKFMNSLPYARIHNEGGIINHPTRQQMLYFKVNRKSGAVRFAKSRTEKQRAAAHDWYNATIGAHTSRMPKRQFMGDSPVLRKRMRDLIMQETARTFHLGK